MDYMEDTPVLDAQFTRIITLNQFLGRDQSEQLNSGLERSFNLGFQSPAGVGIVQFQLQLADSETFETIRFNSFTASSTANWLYFNQLADGGQFQPLPAAGLETNVYGGQTVYYSFPFGSLSNTTYWPRWRYFNSDGEESAWFAPPPFTPIV
jgi:hypothetical protein